MQVREGEPAHSNNWDRRPYVKEEGWTDDHRAFRDWLMNELLLAGCEVRTLSAMGMAQVTVEHMVGQGWCTTQSIEPYQPEETEVQVMAKSEPVTPGHPDGCGCGECELRRRPGLRPPENEIRAVFGDPEVSAAEPCDEYCDPECVHHVPSVGWDLSVGSRINVGPRDSADPRLIVSLHLSDDAIATGMVYGQATAQQVVDFAQQLLHLVGAQWKLVPASPAPAGQD